MLWLTGLLFSLALLVPSYGLAAIALDTSAQSSTGSGTTITITGFSATSGTVLFIGSMTDGASAASVSYNGGTFAELYDAQNDGAGTGRTACYIGVGATDGSAHDLTMTYDSSAGVSYLIVSAWSGVESSSNAAAHRTVYDDGTGTGDLNITVADSQNGDVVVYAVGNFGTNLTAGNTNIITANNVPSTSYDILQQYANASGSNTAMSVTGGQFGQACATALIPASGGAPDVTPFYKRRLQ